jgi:hypothetical protein
MSDDCPPEKKQKMDEEEQQLLDVRKQQEGLDELNEKASEEILGVEKKFNKLRKPLFAKRQEMIRKLEKQCDTKFWWSSFQRHPMLSPMLSSEEEAILGYLSEIEVVDNDDIKSGYEIKFTFDKNPFFSNSVLSKCFFVTEDGEVNNSSPTIEWHTVGADLLNTATPCTTCCAFRERTFSPLRRMRKSPVTSFLIGSAERTTKRPTKSPILSKTTSGPIRISILWARRMKTTKWKTSRRTRKSRETSRFHTLPHHVTDFRKY